jgi:hypothetical protein
MDVTARHLWHDTGMTKLTPPRDWFSTCAGVAAALGLAALLAYVFAGPAARLMAQPWPEVWVNIVRPTQPPAAPTNKAAPATKAAPLVHPNGVQG